ncbi:HAD family hydrolase [Streptomyces sp. NPDC001178]
MNGPLRAVVFDLDGTLADTPAAIRRLLVRVCAEHGRTVAPEEAAPTVGIPLEQAFGRLLGTAPDDPRTGRAVARYRELFDAEVLGTGTRLLHAGVPEGLARLRKAGIALAVATAKVSRSAHALLDALHIGAHFSVVIGHDMVSRGKPHPESGLAAAHALGIPPDGCAYVGDTVGDMRMAVAAGMRPVAVTYGVGSGDALAAVPGTTVCDTFPDVVTHLLEAVPTRPAPEDGTTRAPAVLLPGGAR